MQIPSPLTWNCKGDTEKQLLAGLKFHGQTSVSTNIDKRLCSELSPLTESVDGVPMNERQALIAEHFISFTTEIKEEMDIRERNKTPLRVKWEAEVLEEQSAGQFTGSRY